MKRILTLALLLTLFVGFVAACGEKQSPNVDVQSDDQWVSMQEPDPELEQPVIEPEPAQEPEPTPSPELNTSKAVDGILAPWFDIVTNSNMNGKMASLSWRDSSGIERKLTDLGGKVYLIDVWAEWCGPCKMSTPALLSLYNKYSGQGLVIIGINIDDNTNVSNARDFAQSEGVKYPILHDPQGANVSGVFVDQGIPNFTLLDRNGNTLKIHTGAILEDSADTTELEEIINSQL